MKRGANRVMIGKKIYTEIMGSVSFVKHDQVTKEEFDHLYIIYFSLLAHDFGNEL